MRKKGRKWLLRILMIVIMLTGAARLFMYKIRNGFPVSYETDPPRTDFPKGKPAVLVFSKTTGYRHSGSIDAAKKVFQQLGNQHGWFVYETEEGGVFNPAQLRRFQVVIFNNCTGRLLNKQQQQAAMQYVTAGGVLMGIHGAGDFSHDDWPWYKTHLVGTEFSHHPLKPQLQAASVHRENAAAAALLTRIPATWTHTDEWYIYFSQPRNVHVLAYIDGTRIIPDGNLPLMGGKNFGMGMYHPVAWYRSVGKGKTFYTSMGHNAAVWKDSNFVQLLDNALQWSVKP
ncbi:ThuA domain-containing protein [Dyadobacter sandarakinus]|uniref:ThuA domain-containing protein n=1 Tax=Dyadobacter sandarakinus TaxID=2747268 RepID=A0ABX7I4E0_9BACT|nr:ThuA domain-containing protein [Dyadobacter sandarakinus]QRR00728.1 ThuA domain-containing protein [Dyadobacter sandarakinus]